MDKPARVVVTGLGVLSAFGQGRAEFEAGLFASASALRPITSLDTSRFACHWGGELPGFDTQGLVRKADAHCYDRVSLLALAAADEALAEAGLDPQSIGGRAGVMMGSAFGPAASIQDAVERVARDQRLRPTTLLKIMLNGPTAALAARYGLERASTAHVTACAASGHALAQATRSLQQGEMDVCLAGGAEAFPGTALFAAWDALAVMSPQTDPATGIMRPFTRERQGFVIGEAAAVLVLERLEHAQARGARILGEILGSGAVSDTPSLTRPTQRGMAGAMRAALADAGLSPAQVGHINAHGTATDLNDALESAAIAEVFGAGPVVSACKPAVGHCMGAGSALEAVATVLALQRQQAPHAVDPFWEGVGLAPAWQGGGRTVPLATDVALSNSFAFGGHFVSLAFRRFPATSAG
ncbi:beta-ketoacyl-[acyl-carrier-protein] synthase family protein [Pararhodospirillum photometricum]|uniref:Beta-ketoacyl synthase n=1 Tax=Pararhodospirillum photometricum DSM 122 TaxID=1150469 RepID=H6SS57_PARPM|nr:beta-ketoacyl-[acyl-carrier-protein] synthase family protein [Pararhodospirillum photometricum]CCG07736.1 Beta-ketoacyl synthase [Pararhodospirillum photometricum DSM 122]